MPFAHWTARFHAGGKSERTWALVFLGPAPYYSYAPKLPTSLPEGQMPKLLPAAQGFDPRHATYVLSSWLPGRVSDAQATACSSGL